MKRNVLLISMLCLLLVAAALPVSAYVRVSYGADRLAPQAELIKTALLGDAVCFSETDFKQALGVSRLSNITLLSLPAAETGTLTWNGRPAVSGQMLDRGEIAALTFTPASPETQSATFEFCANSACGTTALRCTLRFTDRINYAPTTADVTERTLHVTTQKGIGVFGCMTAKDPEGDTLTYLIVSYPTMGTLTAVNAENGEFCYLPQAKRTGKDSFTYVARDAYGNYSLPTTVHITVEERKSTLEYVDMKNSPAYLAALTVTERGIMLGTLAGNGMYFHPDEELSRSEFVVMAMKSAGITPAAGVEKTWFDDDAKIPDADRAYIATAQLLGYIHGSFDGEGLYFEPTRAITRAEAAMVLANILDTPKPSTLPTFRDQSTIPAWAADAIYALYDVGILAAVDDGSMAAEKPMTRAQAACAFFEVIRQNG